MNTRKKGKVYENGWPIVAICYDFDKTLSPKDMQNFDLIPKLKCRVNSFWKESNQIAKANGMDKILAYMKLIIDKARGLGDKVTIRRAFEITQPTLSHHMKILCECGLVNDRKEGKWHHYSLNCETLTDFKSFIENLSCIKEL